MALSALSEDRQGSSSQIPPHPLYSSSVFGAKARGRGERKMSLTLTVENCSPLCWLCLLLEQPLSGHRGTMGSACSNAGFLF